MSNHTSYTKAVVITDMLEAIAADQPADAARAAACLSVEEIQTALIDGSKEIVATEAWYEMEDNYSARRTAALSRESEFVYIQAANLDTAAEIFTTLAIRQPNFSHEGRICDPWEEFPFLFKNDEPGDEENREEFTSLLETREGLFCIVVGRPARLQARPPIYFDFSTQ